MDVPTDPTTQSQADLLAVDAEYLWHPWSPSRVSPETLVAVSGEGCEVLDADGRRYLDAKSSGLNATLGYGCRPVIDAVTAQMARLMTYDMGEGANVPAIELAERIAELAGPLLTRTFFCNSGSEAVESAIRIARFYHAALGSPERNIIVTFDNAYHGSTMGAAACSAGPSPLAAELTPAGFTSVQGPAYGTGGGTAGIEALREFLAAHGTRTAAVMIEPVQARGGYVVPDDYLRAVEELCTRHGALLMMDEVTTGFGRTGLMFGYLYAGVAPDLIATSKGLTAGYMSLGAVTTTQRVFDVFDENKSRAGFVHGHTHSGHASACAAALAVLDHIESEGLLANARARGRQLLDAIGELRTLPIVNAVRGRGLMVAVEFDSSRRAARVRNQMLDAGVLARRTARNVVLAPPLIVTEAQVARIADELVTATLAAVASAARPAA